MSQCCTRYSFIDDPWGWLDVEIDDDDDEAIQTIDAGTTRWRRIASGTDNRPQGRCSHSLTPIGHSCVLLFGGGYIPIESSQFCHFNDLWLFNGLTAQWKRLETFGERPSPRRGHAAQYHDDRFLVVFGGIMSGEQQQTNEHLDDLWMLDLRSLRWEQWLGPSMASMSHHNLSIQNSVWPSPRRGSLSFIHNGIFYLFGGETTENQEELEIFSLGLPKEVVAQTKQQQPQPQPQQDWKPIWTKCTVSERLVEGCPYPILLHLIQPTPMRNMMHSPSIFCEEDGTLFVFGGIIHPNHINRILFKFQVQQDGNNFHETCIYNNDEEVVWPLTRYFHGGCAVVGSNNFVIAGGVGPEGNASDSYTYNAKSKTWALLDQQNGPGPRNGLCMAPLNKTNLLLFGGGEYQTEYFDDTYVLELVGGVANSSNTNDDETMTTSSTSSSEAKESVPCEPADTTTGNNNNLQSSSTEDDTLTPVELVITAKNKDHGNHGETPSLLVEMTHVETLSTYSEFFRKMFDGPFLEANKKQIPLSEVDPMAASICLEYMREQHRLLLLVGATTTTPPTIRSKLQGMEMEELDSIVTLADMWGMYSFLRLLEEVFSTAHIGDRIEEELVLLEYAKNRGFPKLVRKCLKRIKSRFFGSSKKIMSCEDFMDKCLRDVLVDPMLLQEVKDFVKTSLL
jgi:hypothetical protein